MDLIICNLQEKHPHEILTLHTPEFQNTKRTIAKCQEELTITSTNKEEMKDCCTEAAQRGNILMWAAINRRFTPWVRAAGSSLTALLASIDWS